jgi:hypothetical protein
VLVDLRRVLEALLRGPDEVVEQVPRACAQIVVAAAIRGPQRALDRLLRRLRIAVDDEVDACLFEQDLGVERRVVGVARRLADLGREHLAPLELPEVPRRLDVREIRAHPIDLGACGGIARR